uniref:Uncharacterized protein n=1 Tax=Electrophorus electricus TaxID=8005 RepID=A0AAY5EIA8_ELEEL
MQLEDTESVFGESFSSAVFGDFIYFTAALCNFVIESVAHLLPCTFCQPPSILFIENLHYEKMAFAAVLSLSSFSHTINNLITCFVFLHHHYPEHPLHISLIFVHHYGQNPHTISDLQNYQQPPYRITSNSTHHQESLCISAKLYTPPSNSPKFNARVPALSPMVAQLKPEVLQLSWIRKPKGGSWTWGK